MISLLGFLLRPPLRKEQAGMKMTDQLTDYVNAAHAGLWIETREPDEAEREIIRHAQQKRWRIAWPCWRGDASSPQEPSARSARMWCASTSLAALRWQLKT